MHKLMASFVTFSALALLSTGCGDKKSDTAPIAPAADEVVLNVPGMH